MGKHQFYIPSFLIFEKEISENLSRCFFSYVPTNVPSPFDFIPVDMLGI